jgi:hypothetical protein
MHRFVADLASVHPLRVDPDQAADIVWATNATEMYQLLVGQRGWSPQRYEHFLADTWHRLLLADLRRLARGAWFVPGGRRRLGGG